MILKELAQQEIDGRADQRAFQRASAPDNHDEENADLPVDVKGAGGIDIENRCVINRACYRAYDGRGHEGDDARTAGRDAHARRRRLVVADCHQAKPETGAQQAEDGELRDEDERKRRPEDSIAEGRGIDVRCIEHHALRGANEIPLPYQQSQAIGENPDANGEIGIARALEQQGDDHRDSGRDHGAEGKAHEGRNAERVDDEKSV